MKHIAMVTRAAIFKDEFVLPRNRPELKSNALLLKFPSYSKALTVICAWLRIVGLRLVTVFRLKLLAEHRDVITTTTKNQREELEMFCLAFLVS